MTSSRVWELSKISLTSHSITAHFFSLEIHGHWDYHSSTSAYCCEKYLRFRRNAQHYFLLLFSVVSTLSYWVTYQYIFFGCKSFLLLSIYVCYFSECSRKAISETNRYARCSRRLKSISNLTIFNFFNRTTLSLLVYEWRNLFIYLLNIYFH